MFRCLRVVDAATVAVKMDAVRALVPDKVAVWGISDSIRAEQVQLLS